MLTKYNSNIYFLDINSKKNFPILKCYLQGKTP